MLYNKSTVTTKKCLTVFSLALFYYTAALFCMADEHCERS